MASIEEAVKIVGLQLINKEIATRAAKGLKTRVTRQAVARIRVTIKKKM